MQPLKLRKIYIYQIGSTLFYGLFCWEEMVKIDDHNEGELLREPDSKSPLHR